MKGGVGGDAVKEGVGRGEEGERASNFSRTSAIDPKGVVPGC